LLLVAFLLINAPNCHLSLVLALVVQGDAVNCNISNPSPVMGFNHLKRQTIFAVLTLRSVAQVVSKFFANDEKS